MNKRKYLFLIVLATFVSFLACRSKIYCGDFKSGKFSYYSPRYRSDIIVERSDSIQIETIANAGISAKIKIAWKSACEFEMIAAKDNRSAAQTDSLTRITPIAIKILSVGPDYFVCSAQEHELKSAPASIYVFHKIK